MSRERRVGIRELKSTLSECLREVKEGRAVVVTEHGDPVARIIPEAVSIRERLDALRQAGAVAWSGQRLRRSKPVARTTEDRTVADLVGEDRE